MNNRQENLIKKWLDKLQEESWNLELLISGFSIFGLFKAFDFLKELFNQVNPNEVVSNDFLGIVGVFLSISLICVCIFIFFLLIHVIFRGIWIGAIGLRYVSGDIDYEKFKYNPVFKRYIKKNVGTFDNYILRLEKISSLIFGYTFLFIFILLSFALYLVFLVLITRLLDKIPDNSTFLRIVFKIIIFIIVLFGMISAFDFMALGLLKRIKYKWFAKVYLVINRFVSLITLSFIWKPLYYNLIDHNRVKWLIPFSAIFLLLFVSIPSSLGYGYFSIMPSSFETDMIGSELNSINFKEKSRFSFTPIFYDNLRDQNEEKEIIKVMSLESNEIKESYINLFVKLYSNDKETILSLDKSIVQVTLEGVSFFNVSDYEESLNKRWYPNLSAEHTDEKQKVRNNYKFWKNEQEKYRKNLEKILNAAKKVYAVKINGNEIPKDSISILFHKHQNLGEEGFLLSFPLIHAKKGRNLLTLEKTFFEKEANEYLEMDFSIPFNYHQ